MALDANNVWQYTEDESASPFSELLNRGMSSVSDAIGPHVIDSGWISVSSFETGWNTQAVVGSSNHLEYRRVGYTVEIRGLVARTGAEIGDSTTANLFTIPIGFRPAKTVLRPFITNGSWATQAQSTGTAHTHGIMGSSTMGPYVRGTLSGAGVFAIVIPAGVTIPNLKWVSASMTYFVD